MHGQRKRRKGIFHGGQTITLLFTAQTSLGLDSALSDAHATHAEVTRLDFALLQWTVSISHRSHRHKPQHQAVFANYTSGTETEAILMGSDCTAQRVALPSIPDNIFFTKKGGKRTVHAFMSPRSHCTCNNKAVDSERIIMFHIKWESSTLFPSVTFAITLVKFLLSISRCWSDYQIL